jgi:sec-independent protein translocase protein TatC
MSMKTKKKSKNHRRASLRTQPVNQALPFIEHAKELRRRLYYIAAAVLLWGTAAYAVEHAIVRILLKPAGNQHFIYTSPGGGIDFLFRICLYAGLIFSLPVIVYNGLRFIEPIISKESHHFVAIISLTSTVLAAAGILFGYFMGLPAALHFLFHQFTTTQIQPLVTIQSYLSFVLVYMVGSALLFQLPLFLIVINRVRPLQPRRLFRYERWVILAAFVLAGLMNPSPNVLSQLLVAGPFILMYQLGIGIIALINRGPVPDPLELLYQQDLEAQASRRAGVPALKPLVDPAPLSSKTAPRPLDRRPANPI